MICYAVDMLHEHPLLLYSICTQLLLISFIVITYCHVVFHSHRLRFSGFQTDPMQLAESTQNSIKLINR